MPEVYIAEKIWDKVKLMVQTVSHLTPSRVTEVLVLQVVIENGAHIISTEQLVIRTTKEKFGVLLISRRGGFAFTNPDSQVCGHVLCMPESQMLVIYGLPDDKKTKLTIRIVNFIKDRIQVSVVDTKSDIKNIHDGFKLISKGKKVITSLKTDNTETAKRITTEALRWLI